MAHPTHKKCPICGDEIFIGWPCRKHLTPQQVEEEKQNKIKIDKKIKGKKENNK